MVIYLKVIMNNNITMELDRTKIRYQQQIHFRSPDSEEHLFVISQSNHYYIDQQKDSTGPIVKVFQNNLPVYFKNCGNLSLLSFLDLTPSKLDVAQRRLAMNHILRLQSKSDKFWDDSCQYLNFPSEFQMEQFKVTQEKAFRSILNLQRSKMESKVAFALAMTLKLLLKDGFIILLIILPLGPIPTLTENLLTKLPSQSLPITIMLGLIVIAAGLAYMGAAFLEMGKGKYGLLLGPWIDVFAFPLIAVLMVVAQSDQNQLLTTTAILITITVTLLQLVYNATNFTKSPKTTDLFQHAQAKLSLIANLLHLCFLFPMLVRWIQRTPFSSQERVLFTILHLLLSAMRFKEQALQRYFISPFSQKVGIKLYLMEINLGVIAFAHAASDLGLIADNLPYILLNMTILSNLSLRTYLHQRQNKMHLSKAAEIKGQSEAKLYLDSLGELAKKIQNEEDDIILISLRKRHEMDCCDKQCFCIDEDIPLNDFIKEYIGRELDVLAQLFHNTPSLLLLVLYFKMVLFKLYPQILTKTAEYKKRFSLSLLQRFYCFWLTDFVGQFIQHKNQEIEAVESQEMFRLQTIREEMVQTIRGEVEEREKKWRYLARGLCQVGELQQQTERVLSSIKKMVTIFQQNKVKFKKSKQFNLLLLFYFQKISFLKNGKQLRTNLKQIYYGYKVKQLHSLKEFRKFIFHKQSCAIETLVDIKSMGTITNVSKNIVDMFGVPPDKAKGLSINVMMPDFMGKQHQKILDNWTRSGTWRTIGKLKQIFCIHKEHFCFSALLYLKIYLKNGALHLITNIFQLNDSDYLVLSPDGRIAGLGRKFIKILGEGSQNIPFNLFIENTTNLPSKDELEAEKVYRKVLMGTTGLEQKVEAHNLAMSQLLDIEGRQEEQDGFYYTLKGSANKHFAEFTVQWFTMGKVRFQVLQLKDSRAIQKHKTEFFISGLNIIQNVSDNDIDVESSKASQDHSEVEEKEGSFEQLAISSMASTSEKENYPLTKMTEKCLHFLLRPSQLKDRRTLVYQIVLIVLLLLMVGIFILNVHFYRAIYLEVKGIFFSNGAVSDIMQCTELAFTHTFELRRQLLAGQITQFQANIATTHYIQNYTYSLSSYNFHHIASDSTSFTNKRFYQYIQQPSTWQLASQTAQLDTYQFLQHMYYITGQMVQELEQVQRSNSTYLNLQYLQILTDNFQEMARLNQHYLLYYQQVTETSLALLNYFSICSMLLFAVLTLLFSCFINAHYKFRFSQEETCFHFLTFVPHQVLEKMKDYYSKVREDVIKPGRLRDIDQHEGEVFGADREAGKGQGQSSFSKIKFINYSTYSFWVVVLVVFFCLNGVNYLINSSIRNFIGPSQTIIDDLNSLMRGQNRLIEGYIHLKSRYYLNPSLLNASFFDSVQQHLDSAGKDWNVYANQVRYVLQGYDPLFQPTFDHSLETNVCTLGSPDLSPQMVSKCRSELQLQLLDSGIMVSMNFFTKNVREALSSLRAQYVTLSQNRSSGDYFSRLDFTEVDKMEFFMFKIYQLTQSISYESYVRIIQILINQYIIFTVIMIVAAILRVLFTFREAKLQKVRLSRLHARLLLVPFDNLKGNVRIVNSFKEAVEYQQD